MSSQHRRSVQPGDRDLRTTTLNGTHAMGGWAGTISFPIAFAGTPVVMLTQLAGSTSFGRTIQLGVRDLQSGSFTYRGSPGHGTFTWFATGPSRGNV